MINRRTVDKVKNLN